MSWSSTDMLPDWFAGRAGAGNDFREAGGVVGQGGGLLGVCEEALGELGQRFVGVAAKAAPGSAGKGVGRWSIHSSEMRSQKQMCQSSW